MFCLAQIAHRHRRVDALGLRVCSYMHFALMYVMYLPAPEDQSIAWFSLLTFTGGNGTDTCMAGLA